MLPNVNLLYLGATVLILLDESYMRRFWTLFEGWLAFSMPTAERGIVAAPAAQRRLAITCMDSCQPARSRTSGAIAVQLPHMTS